MSTNKEIICKAMGIPTMDKEAEQMAREAAIKLQEKQARQRQVDRLMKEKWGS